MACRPRHPDFPDRRGQMRRRLPAPALLRRGADGGASSSSPRPPRSPPAATPKRSSASSSRTTSPRGGSSSAVTASCRSSTGRATSIQTARRAPHARPSPSGLAAAAAASPGVHGTCGGFSPLAERGVEDRHRPLPTGREHREQRRGCDHVGLAGSGSRRGRAVAARRPAVQPSPVDELRRTLLHDESPVRQLRVRHEMQQPAARGRVDPLGVQLRVDRVRPVLPGVQLEPAGGEGAVILAPAESTGAVACCECSRLVEEEELGEPAGLQKR